MIPTETFAELAHGPRVRGGAILLLAITCCARAPAPGGSVHAGPLASPLVLLDGQQGAAGETGTVTTISPDGRFTVARYLGDVVEPPERAGKLDPDSVSRLARALDEELSPPLPERVGAPGGANPRQVRIRYRGSTVSLVLPAGANLDRGSSDLGVPAGTPVLRVLRVRQLVTELVDRPGG